MRNRIENIIVASICGILAVVGIALADVPVKDFFQYNYTTKILRTSTGINGFQVGTNATTTQKQSANEFCFLNNTCLTSWGQASNWRVTSTDEYGYSLGDNFLTPSTTIGIYQPNDLYLGKNTSQLWFGTSTDYWYFNRYANGEFDLSYYKDGINTDFIKIEPAIGITLDGNTTSTGDFYTTGQIRLNNYTNGFYGRQILFGTSTNYWALDQYGGTDNAMRLQYYHEENGSAYDVMSFYGGGTGGFYAPGDNANYTETWLFQDIINGMVSNNLSQSFIKLNPLITQSGTASYKVLDLFANEYTLGSGTNYLIYGSVSPAVDPLRVPFTVDTYGNTTTTGHLSVGSATEYIRAELEPYRVNPALGNIAWLKGSSLGGLTKVFGNDTGLFLRSSGDTIFPHASVYFMDTVDAQSGLIEMDEDTNTMNFKVADTFSFDDDFLVSGPVGIGTVIAPQTAVAIYQENVRTAADAFGVDIVQTVNYDDTLDAYGMRLSPNFGGQVGEVGDTAYVLWLDGTEIGPAFVKNGYGLYIDELNLGGTVRNVGAYIGDNLTIASTTGGGTFGEKLTVVGDTYLVGNATTTGNFTIPTTTNAHSGVIMVENQRFIHRYGPGGQDLFIGLNAGNFTNSGAVNNTAIGENAMKSLTSGDNNSAFGTNALQALTGGSNELAFGDKALYTLQTGNANTAIGTSALYSTNGAIRNSAIGLSAGYYNTTGGYNNFFGSQSGNTAILTNANTIGSNNTYIGHYAGASVPSATSLQYSVAIGNDSLVGCSNCMALGGTTTATRVNVGINNDTPNYQLNINNDGSNATRGLAIENHVDTGGTALMWFKKSQGTRAIPTAMVNGGGISNIISMGYDGSTYVQSAAFGTVVDGVVATNWMPIATVFGSAPAGGVSVTAGEVFRISSYGAIGIGTSTPKAVLTVATSTNGGGVSFENLFQVATSTNQNIFKIDMNGKVYAGNVSEGNYFQIDPNGFIWAFGTARGWDDVNVGAITLGKGATAPDESDWATSTIRILSYAGSGAAQSASGCVEIPHNYAQGTDITPHVHWNSTSVNAGNVKWQLEYNVADSGQIPLTASTTNSIQAAPGHNNYSQRADFYPIPGSGRTIGGQICFRLFRDSTDAEDTYGDAGEVQTFGFHYQRDSLGSRTITTK